MTGRVTPSPYLSDAPCQCAASEAASGGETEGWVLIGAGWAGIYRCVSMCVFAMDFEFILKVAEKRIKAALGKAEAGKIYFTSATASRSAVLSRVLTWAWASSRRKVVKTT